MQQDLVSRNVSFRQLAVAGALGFILLFGAVLRFTGINWDDYQHLHPDERFLTMVETGIKLPGSVSEYFDTTNSPLNPYNENFGTFVYGTYPLFLTKFVGAILTPFGKLIAQHMTEPAQSDFGAYGTLYRLLADPGGYDGIHIIGRMLSGLSDLLTVLLIFFIGRRLYSTRVGLLAAFFLAFSVLDIQQSHFFTVDTFANLPLVLAVWFTLDIADGRGGWRSFILTGAFFGLALAARINLATFAAIITLAGVLRLIKGLEGVKLERVTVPTLSGTRTFEFATEAIVGGDDPGDVDATLPGATSRPDIADPDTTTRVVNLGPLSFEVQSRPRPPVSPVDKVERIEPIQPTPPVPEIPQIDPGELTTITRAVNLGPVSFELHSTRRLPSTPAIAIEEPLSVIKAELTWVEPLRVTVIGLGLAAIVALLVFRVAQPYAFQGLGLNPKWVQDISSLKDLLSGQNDYPPSHQWTGRNDYLFPWVNIVMWGLGLPLGLAAWAGFVVAAFELARRRYWSHLLIFFWVGGTFFYEGQQFVKTMRYSLPIYPFLALFGSYFLFWLWDAVRAKSRVADLFSRLRVGIIPRVLVVAVFLITVGYTLFWSTAFASIYTRDVTRYAASIWIVHNIPQNSVIANEHWDDPLPLRVEGLDPFGNMFKGVPTSSDGELQMYAEDTPEKRGDIVKWLDASDYIVLSSNRLYLSIPRLPLRFPMTTKYYQWLFDGTLGFKVIKTFTSYPQLFGITINDDGAEEAFSVYDHPKVLIFQKTSAYSHDKLVSLLNGIDLSEVYRQKPIDYDMSHAAFQLHPQDAADDRAGGTWSDIFNPDDLVNRIPVVVWLILLELLGVLAFPVTFAVFRGFADRGYAFAKALGILALGWGAWTLASYHLMGFSRESISIVLLALILLAIIAAWRQGRDLIRFVLGNLPLLLIEELVFFAFFFGFLLIRYGNPDLWHPYFGGEKPMDFTYLNSVIKTTWFPPYNAWFEGGYINYYYFGQLISATLVRFTGILPEVAYNLLLPMFFSLTALGAFGVAFNLVTAVAARSLSSAMIEARHDLKIVGRAVVAGLLAAVFVVVIGNLGEVGVLGDGLMKSGEPSSSQIPVLGGALTILSGAMAWLFDGKLPSVPIGNWYWTSTRVIPDTINEFPFFTFLYADLHAHLMGLAYTLVALGSGLNAVLIRGRFKWYDLGVVALVLGALRAINTWDYPTYLALIGGAMVIGCLADRFVAEEPQPSWSERLRRYIIWGVIAFIQIMVVVIPINAIGIKMTLDMIAYALMLSFGLILGWIVVGGSFDPRVLTRVLGWRFMALVALSVIFYFPFMDNYGTAYTSVTLWKDPRTSLPDYLVVHGIFLFMASHISYRRESPQSRPLFDGRRGRGGPASHLVERMGGLRSTGDCPV